MGVYSQVCEQQVDFDDTTTHRFLHSFPGFVVAAKLVELWGVLLYHFLVIECISAC